MEFSEVQELDYIVAQSMSRNIFGLTTSGKQQNSNKFKSGRYNPVVHDQSDEDSDGQTRMHDQMFSQNKGQDNQESPLNGLLKNNQEMETMDDLLSEINSIVSVQYDSKKKQFEVEEEEKQRKSIKEKELAEIEEQKKIELANQESKKSEQGEEESKDEKNKDGSASNKNSKQKKQEKDESEDDDEEYDDEEDDDEEEESNNNKNNGENQQDNQDKFEQVTEENIIQSFTNVVLKQVSMLKNTSSQKQGNNKLRAQINNAKAKKMDIYFFCTSFNMKIPFDDQTTTRDYIKIIIECYMADPNTDKNQMRYHMYPQAYELRIKDDESFKPDNLPPLEQKRLVNEFKIDAAVFLEIEKFKPPASNTEENVSNQFRQLKSQKGEEVLTIKIDETGSTTIISISSNSTIKEVLEYLKVKKNQKILIKDCIVQYHDPSEDKYNDVDFSTPVNKLPTFNLRIRKKEWADGPRVVNNVVQYAQNIPTQLQQNEPISNMNLVKYEEFKVIKINDKGRKQERILGIDEHKILNINQRIQAQNIGFLDRIFVDPRTGTKNPQRAIENIQSIQELDNNVVIMKIKDPEHQYDKTLKYVIDNVEDRKKMIKKIEGLLDLQKKNQIKKMNMTNIMTYTNQYGTTSLR